MTLPVIVIGSGCTGLALAQGLRKRSIPCVVFERDDSIVQRPRDWNMGLHWAIPILLDQLGDDFNLPAGREACHIFRPVQVDPSTLNSYHETLNFVNGATGELMASIDCGEMYRLKRRATRTLLSKGIDIRYGKKLASINYSLDDENKKTVTAIFEDGSTFTGSLLVGADGARSTVRSLLLTPEPATPTQLPFSVTFLQCRFNREQALYLRSFHPLFYPCYHPKGYMAWWGLQEIPNPEDPESWLFFFFISWSASRERQDAEAKVMGDKERIQQVHELGAQFTDPWKSACQWLKGDENLWHFDIAVWDPLDENHQWSNRDGRVTLAGDAAHVMTFQRGQGLNHAMADVGALVKQIEAFAGPGSTKSQPEAIGAYEQQMKTRGGEEVRSSIINTQMLHDFNQVMESPLMKRGIRPDQK